MRVILPQIAQITQRGMQQAALSRRERQIGVSLAWGIVVLLFICDYLRDLREIYWGFFVQLIKYSCVFILPQMAQRSQRECSRAALFRRERHLVVNVVVGVRLRKSARSAGDIGVSLCNRLSTLM